MTCICDCLLLFVCFGSGNSKMFVQLERIALLPEVKSIEPIGKKCQGKIENCRMTCIFVREVAF